MIIHDLHQVSSPDLSHLALLIVKLPDLTIESPASFHESFKINNIIEVTFNSGNLADQCLDFLVSEYRSYPAPSGLFKPDFFSSSIIKAAVQHSYKIVLWCGTRRNHTDVFLFTFIISKHFSELLGEHMTVGCFKRRFKYFYIMIYAVDVHYYIFLCLALDLNCIEASKLQKRSEESAHVAVHNGVCLG